jgi:hypothetical protein
VSEFAETFSEPGTGRFESIKSLWWLKRRVRKGDATTYPFQIIDQPPRITILKVRHVLPKPLPMEDIAEFVVKPG